MNFFGTLQDAIQHVRIRFLCILMDIYGDDIVHVVWSGGDVIHDFLIFGIMLDDFKLHRCQCFLGDVELMN